MQMSQSIGLKLEQTAQPQQILRSELIQTPLIQLEARFQQEFEQNPLLEVVEDIEITSDDRDDGSLESSAVEEARKDSEERDAREAEAEEREPDWEEYFDEQDDAREDERRLYKSNQAITEAVEIPQADVQTLAESLTDQLRMDKFSEKQMLIGEYIIGSLDARGFLDASTELIAELAGATRQEVEVVLRRVQRYDPPGIAARDLRECLLIQLEVKGEKGSVAWHVLHDHFESFTNRRFEIIASALGITPLEVQESFESIASLNPRPGEGVIDARMNYIIPDLVVEVIREDEDAEPEFAVMLNDGNIPSFYVNEDMKRLILKQNGSNKEARDFALKKAESARWFIAAIMQRRTTMLRTMRAIVERQKPWFLSGRDEHLKPMILQDIAEDIGMDISTISRVSRDKYVQTPYGVREIKFFFNDRIGEDTATIAIKTKLKEIVDAEDKRKPLSDNALMNLLEEHGYKIARRTVQKYREQLGIPVKRLRRQVG